VTLLLFRNIDDLILTFYFLRFTHATTVATTNHQPPTTNQAIVSPRIPTKAMKWRGNQLLMDWSFN
jgi:hypothetical protein